MELPQSRPFKAQGREPTHDFLSLCSHSTLQTEPKPTPSSQAGSHLKTHDFLQPLEETSRIDTTKIATEKPPPLPPLQHVLPGGIGTYTISSIPYFSNHQRVPKPELSPPMMFTASGGGGVERNAVDAAAVASGFTLWDESGSGNKGQTRKDNNSAGGERAGVATTMGQWPVVEQRSQSLTNNNNPLSGFSSRSSSQGSGLKSQSFMDMIRSAKGTSPDDDLDDDEDFIMKKESSSTSQNHIDLRVKASNDPKLNTPRSKHSATEQRRRSKINDRFQMLRQLIPNSDQKRDKASFLLEVIEYIQFLQEKTSKYETPYQGWNQEPAKLLNWQRNNNQQLVPEGTVAFAPKLEQEKNNIPVLATAETLNRERFPLSVQSSSLFSPVIAGNPVTELQARVASSSETAEPNPSSRSHTQPLKEEGDDEEGREGNNISVSSVYSQGLVKRLREALEKSGVDLTKTSISVEIELAKQLSSFKNHEDCDPVSRTGIDKQTRKPKRLKTYSTS
ncbi:transcription factor BIM1 isoform X4 [Raphanus sativus]|uniref:Transcription factor BIM1 isoform X4 n=1 Tax=Raphanus sativus TaxID=3726 RepID=A0A9W3DCA2_RAPSA|nr:transcription factor BIM1 isoform X4 [Raphanus sativus]